MSTQRDFVESVLKAAVNIEKKHGLPAAAIAAQACLETGYGKYVPKEGSKYSYNLFGIKGTGPAGSVKSQTWEVYNGKTVTVMAGFKAFNSYEESFEGYADFIFKNSRYTKARSIKDPDEYLKEIHRAGYATDPLYVSKLQSIMSQFGMRELARKYTGGSAVSTETAPWKLMIMDEATKEGLITSADHKPDEPAPKWFVLATILNATTRKVGK